MQGSGSVYVRGNRNRMDRIDRIKQNHCFFFILSILSILLIAFLFKLNHYLMRASY
jgi:hypothetical protein